MGSNPTPATMKWLKRTKRIKLPEPIAVKQWSTAPDGYPWYGTHILEYEDQLILHKSGGK